MKSNQQHRLHTDEDAERFEAVAGYINEHSSLNGWAIVEANHGTIARFADAGATVEQIGEFAITPLKVPA